MIPWEGAVKYEGLGTATKLVGALTAGLWLAAILVSRRLRKPGVFHLVVLLMVAWYGASIFWSDDPKITFDHLATWLQLLILVFILWDLYTSQRELLAGLQAYVLGAYVSVGVALANYLSGKPFYDHYQRFSPGETTNPDGFGTMLAMGIPMALYLATSGLAGERRRLLQFVNYGYILAAFIGISLSGTRTALIAAIPALAFGLASLTRIRLWARVTIFVALTAAIVLLLPRVQSLRSFERFSTILPELAQGDLNNRTNNWREGLDSFTENPLVGVGGHRYRTVNTWGKVAHNTFLSMLVELGLVGFLLFAAVLAIAVSQAWKHRRWDKSFWITQFVVWAICASTLAWEDKKITWLFLTLMTASGAAGSADAPAEEPEPQPGPVGQVMWPAQ